MSRHVLFGIILQTLLLNFLFAKDGSAQNESVHDIHLSLDWENINLDKALADLEAKTAFSFTYNSAVVNKSQRFNLKEKNKSLAQILMLMSEDANLKFRRVNENIHVTRKVNYTDPYLQNLEYENYDKAISGQVTDENGEGLPGVNVKIKDYDIGVITNIDGSYKLNVPDDASVLIFSYVGYIAEEVEIGTQSVINVALYPNIEELDEIVVVGFGTQKKEAVVGAMTSVKPAELKIPSSNLTTALAGRVSGVISYQTSGEPGEDNAQFFVRGVASFNNQNGPLILIDGVELTIDDLARLQPDDIESFSVLKDPTTTAIYGARGANGIILVTTKTGEDGPARINLRIENSFSEPVSTVELADPVTHMRLQNEAHRTRGEVPTFREEQIKGTIDGGNPNLYPATDWFEQLFKERASTTRVNLNVRGGGKKVRYYVAGSFNKDNGLLKVDKTNNFTNGINLKRYLLRSNVNIDLHENTEMIVRLHSTIDDYRGPLQGGNAIYNAAVRTSPVRFRATYDPDEELAGVPHIIFGNGLAPRGSFGSVSDLGAVPVWFNPYAELQRGYRDTRRQLSLVQLEFKQDLSSILPGLSARFLGNVNSTSFFENRRSYQPFFYRVSTFDPFTEEYDLIRTAQGSGNTALELIGGDRTNNSVLYMEAAANYYQTFAEKHNVSGLLVFTAREFLDGNANSVQLSLPSRNITFAGRYNYDYDNRYFLEFNFGYNGSERFAKNNRFGFFPSFGAGWLISNESFFNSAAVSRLKLRASFGWVGNDKIGDTRADRFFYLSEVDLTSGANAAIFGELFNNVIPGVSISRYANPLVTWELARKANLGLEVNLFDDAIQFRVDAFHENRSRILQQRQDVPSTLGLQAPLKTNVGEVVAKGIDASIDVNHYFNNDFWVTGRATFVYADNEFSAFEEPNYTAVNSPWRSNIGNNVSVAHGYIAERLFIDNEEALNSPTQFGIPGVDYGGGDIKYKDLNGDGVITTLDQAPIGKPTIPKITYGFGASVGYKRWDLNVFFQGLAETSFFINPVTTGPFLNSILGSNFGLNQLDFGNGRLSENGLLKAFAEDYWSEEDRNPYALYPRLSPEAVENNIQRSTFWLRDGSFLRLKQVEVGYNLITSRDNKKISTLRIYASGTNLALFSKFRLWDPELGGNGLNYPLQKVINLGVNIGF
ncbi:TonB-dependent receptor [Fulvivirgaceae bacterium BMA10]|uniref:TonB-dependent receptor n=1 Tax=Splendidivirga corallicola TaxID=3051826 RepID=A0ABT8KXC1_9BACT|nr:TonB-dependent receptor [Fulvivirgaceae bacterium BMA10]